MAKKVADALFVFLYLYASQILFDDRRGGQWLKLLVVVEPGTIDASSCFELSTQRIVVLTLPDGLENDLCQANDSKWLAFQDNGLIGTNLLP